MEFFRTERLLIRRFEQRDATGLFDYFSAPRANCFVSEKLNNFEEAEAEAEKTLQNPVISEFLWQ